MAKDELLVTGEKPEQKKLGPSVTYRDLDGVAKHVAVAGIPFRDGQAVDLVEQLGDSDQTRRLLAKLDGNPYFDVQGGQKSGKENQGSVGRETAFLAAPHVEAVARAEQEAALRGEDPPEGYDAPLEAVLERPALPGRKGK